MQWLESYLSNRSLSVKLGNAESWSFYSTSGVPQGSNVGPLLFSIFFNDVCLVLPKGCKIVYADNVKIYSEVRTADDCRYLQQLIDIFSDWCTANRLGVSVLKCSVISFTRKKSPLIYSYTLLNEPIKRESIVKDLGVLLDCGMTFQDHS